MTRPGVAIPRRVQDRVWQNVDVLGPDECWPWLAGIGTHGYGMVGWSERGVETCTTAHRVAWTAVNGPIPEYVTIDHRRDRCPGGNCCNPLHMRLLSNEENGRDNGQVHKTHCPAGHEYDEANTYRTSLGHRQCRACSKEADRRRYPRPLSAEKRDRYNANRRAARLRRGRS